jgi:hypothetical protein
MAVGTSKWRKKVTTNPTNPHLRRLDCRKGCSKSGILIVNAIVVGVLEGINNRTTKCGELWE